MAIQDGVDVGILGLLRGQMRKLTHHEPLSRVMLGSAIGALAIDAGVPAIDVLACCEDAIGQAISGGRSDDARHRALAIKLLRMAIQELAPTEPNLMDLCRILLSRVETAASSPAVHDAILALGQSISDAQSKVTS